MKQFNLDFKDLKPLEKPKPGYSPYPIGVEGTSGGPSAVVPAAAAPDTPYRPWGPYGVARRGKGDPRRTRVSFLLF